MAKVFVSDSILQERLAPSPSLSDQVPAPWGWKALSAFYQDSLAACGYWIAPILRPEIYQTDIARKVLGVELGDWHLAVKPIEHLRPFHGIPNVFVCDWPFPELSAVPMGDSPFFDQVRLVRMAEAVLCCTDFTRDTLRRAGVEQAITLPPSIPSPPDAARPRPDGGCRFLSIIDRDQLFRQLGPTIAGFAKAARQRDGLSLTLCIQGADREILASLHQRLADVMPPGEAEETVAIRGAGADGGAEFYAAADVFLCADAAAGLRLPLVRAMLTGLPIVATMTTGTASFLPPEAAVPIATEPETLLREDEPIARFLPLTIYPPTAATLCDAVLAAAELDEEVQSRMGKIAQAAAGHRFGLAAFRTGLDELRALLSRDRP